MYFATSHSRQPKHKVACIILTTDGDSLEGSLFTTGDQRIKDLLNGENAFIPFEGFDGEIHLLNRATIARVSPRENMASMEGKPAINEKLEVA